MPNPERRQIGPYTLIVDHELVARTMVRKRQKKQFVPGAFEVEGV